MSSAKEADVGKLDNPAWSKANGYHAGEYSMVADPCPVKSLEIAKKLKGTNGFSDYSPKK